MISARHDCVVIRRDETPTESKGGIALTNEERPYYGEVVAVGPGKALKKGWQSMAVKPGDRVLFGKYSGVEFEADGETLLVMREGDVIAVVA